MWIKRQRLWQPVYRPRKTAPNHAEKCPAPPPIPTLDRIIQAFMSAMPRLT